MKKKESRQEASLPMVEIFAGTFAILIIIFLLLQLFVKIKDTLRVLPVPDEGEYKIFFPGEGYGYTVLAFPDKIRIVETGEAIAKGTICSPGSSYISYAKSIYKNKNKLVFAIFENGISQFLEARNCLVKLLPEKPIIQIAWIIVDNELLKSISINQFPAHIKKNIQSSQKGKGILP